MTENHNTNNILVCSTNVHARGHVLLNPIRPPPSLSKGMLWSPQVLRRRDWDTSETPHPKHHLLDPMTEPAGAAATAATTTGPAGVGVVVRVEASATVVWAAPTAVVEPDRTKMNHNSRMPPTTNSAPMITNVFLVGWSELSPPRGPVCVTGRWFCPLTGVRSRGQWLHGGHNSLQQQRLHCCLLPPLAFCESLVER